MQLLRLFAAQIICHRSLYACAQERAVICRSFIVSSGFFITLTPVDLVEGHDGMYVAVSCYLGSVCAARTDVLSQFFSQVA